MSCNRFHGPIWTQGSCGRSGSRSFARRPMARIFSGRHRLSRDGQVHSSYSATDGLGKGRVNSLRFDSEGALWIATEGGLSRLKNGRIATLTSKNGLPCDAVQWTMEDEAQSVWLMMPCGLVRVARSELDAWAIAADKTPARSTPQFSIVRTG